MRPANHAAPSSPWEHAKDLLERPSFPHGLDAVNSLFSGRSQELDQIRNVLSMPNEDRQKRYVITGIGGIGKSELCLRLVEQLRSQ